jgi:transposase-like protein
MTKISYSGYRFPPEIIQQEIWLYLRFTLSFRDVEDLLAGRDHNGSGEHGYAHAIGAGNLRRHL